MNGDSEIAELRDLVRATVELINQNAKDQTYYAVRLSKWTNALMISLKPLLGASSK
jgi:hypothetical protein